MRDPSGLMKTGAADWLNLIGEGGTVRRYAVPAACHNWTIPVPLTSVPLVTISVPARLEAHEKSTARPVLMTVCRLPSGVNTPRFPSLSQIIIRLPMYSAPETAPAIPLRDELVSSFRNSRGRAYQTRTLPSPLAVTTSLPSALKRAALTSSVLPASSVSGTLVERSHTRAGPIPYPATTCVPSGLNAAVIAFGAPADRVATTLRAASRYISTSPSCSAVTTWRPSGLNSASLADLATSPCGR